MFGLRLFNLWNMYVNNMKYITCTLKKTSENSLPNHIELPTTNIDYQHVAVLTVTVLFSSSTQHNINIQGAYKMSFPAIVSIKIFHKTNTPLERSRPDIYDAYDI